MCDLCKELIERSGAIIEELKEEKVRMRAAMVLEEQEQGRSCSMCETEFEEGAVRVCAKCFGRAEKRLKRIRILSKDAGKIGELVEVDDAMAERVRQLLEWALKGRCHGIENEVEMRGRNHRGRRGAGNHTVEPP